MLMRLAVLSVIVVASTLPANAQTPAPEPATTVPATVPVAPGAVPDRSTVTPPPGVTDPMATNSTTGTVDHEDHCQAPGTPSNTNPSADVLTLPRPEPSCN